MKNSFFALKEHKTEVKWEISDRKFFSLIYSCRRKKIVVNFAQESTLVALKNYCDKKKFNLAVVSFAPRYS